MIEKLITCGKYDNIIDFNLINKPKLLRIGSKNPNKLKKRNYIPISTDGVYIFFKNKEYKVRDFLSSVDRKTLNNLIVLTTHERNLIIESLVDFDCIISVFEIKFPIFDNIKYISNLQKNYTYLISLISVIEDLNLNGNTLANNLTTSYRYKIERKLRFKNQYDAYFAFSYKQSYQEVFKLKEERDNRTIIAMDFNSMFVDSMMGKFLLPKKIKYCNFKSKVNVNDLNEGLYKVILKKPNCDFIKEFHYFRFSRLFSTFLFKLKDNDEIEILLFKNELLYYKKFFKDITVIEGFYSKETIEHPLKKDAIKLYNQRKDFKNKNNKIMANLTKLKLILMHSSTNIRRNKKSIFDSEIELKEYLFTEYNIDIDNKFDSTIMKNNPNFKIIKKKSKYILTSPNFSSNETLYSISSQIIAYSNIKMMKTLELFLKFPSLEICYCNVDSIHISINTKLIDEFYKIHNHLFSDKLGDLKVEFIGSKGYWFDVGRYWIFNENNKSIFYKNSVINHKGNKSIFMKNKVIKKIYRTKNLKYVYNKYLNIYDLFSFNKKINFSENIDSLDYLRYNYNEISDLFVADKSIFDEKLKNKKVKVDLFNRIATV